MKMSGIPTSPFMMLTVVPAYRQVSFLLSGAILGPDRFQGWFSNLTLILLTSKVLSNKFLLD